jgi:diguanylate cyclase (GGDEF)-like protein
VEDNPVSRNVLEKTLRKSGYHVTSVSNGRLALELFKEKFFPIVLTDWMMPIMDGLELCKAIRRNTSNGYVFIIFLTGKNSQNDIVRGLEAGADDYLTKPFNQSELKARIKTGIRILELEESLKKANEQIRVLSISDPLTGIFNRRYLNKHLPLEINRAKRYNHPLSLILCDIDHFKQVNDRYGHLVGDQVIKAFVSRIKKSIRDVDWMVRYGGEEFVIVVPETDPGGSYILAERLRNAISQSVVNVQKHKIHITSSFGLTGFVSNTTDHKITFEAMIDQADKCLYKAKMKGRNRVEVGRL